MLDIQKEAVPLLVSESYYTYHDGDSVEWPELNEFKKNSYGDIEEAVILKKITLTDAFYAMGVSRMVHCTMPMLKFFLKWYKRKYPEKNCQFESAQALTGRLRALVTNGILQMYYAQDVKKSGDETGKQIASEDKIYSITQKGALALKEMLDCESLGKYNAWAGIRPAHSILSHLDAMNAVAYLTQSRYCVDVASQLVNYDQKMNVRREIVASMTFKKVDGGKEENIKIFIEPVHTSISVTNIAVSRQEYYEQMSDRMKMLFEKREYMLSAKNNKYSQIRIVFVLDGKDAFHLVSNTIKKIKLSNNEGVDLSCMLLTNYNLLKKAKTLREGFIKVDGSGFSFDDSWILEEI